MNPVFTGAVDLDRPWSSVGFLIDLACSHALNMDQDSKGTCILAQLTPVGVGDTVRSTNRTVVRRRAAGVAANTPWNVLLVVH